MDKTKLTKWFKEHQEELKVLLIMANPRNNPFTPIDPKRIMGYEKDELERFIDELTDRFEQLREERNDETSWLRIELRERYDEYI